MSLLARALCIRTVSRQAVRDNGSARDNGVKAAVLCPTDPGDGWIEKIRLDRRRGSFSASAEPYQSNPEGKSAESPERTEVRLDITDPTSGCDGPVDNRRHTIDRPARIKRGMMHRSGQEPPAQRALQNDEMLILVRVDTHRYPVAGIRDHLKHRISALRLLDRGTDDETFTRRSVTIHRCFDGRLSEPWLIFSMTSC
jgi:hypothetical protein